MTTESMNASRVLTISVSAALASILMGFVVLICTILAIVKCRKSLHTKMHEDKIKAVEEDTESIHTSANICYEGILELDRRQSTLRQIHTDNTSLHLYDDIINTFTVDYENVDPSTGFPKIQKPSSSITDAQHCGKRQSSPNFGGERTCKPKSTSSKQTEEQVRLPVQQHTFVPSRHQHKHIKVDNELLGSASIPIPSQNKPGQLAKMDNKAVPPNPLFMQQCKSLERLLVMKPTTPSTETMPKQHSEPLKRASTLRPVLQCNQVLLKKVCTLKPVFPTETTLDQQHKQVSLERSCTLRPVTSEATLGQHHRRNKITINRAKTVKPVVPLHLHQSLKPKVFQVKNQNSKHKVSVFLEAAEYEIPMKTTDV